MHLHDLPGVRPPNISVPAPVIRLLRVWICHRRTILATALGVALVLLLVGLAPDARDALIRGVLARRSLIGLILFFSLLTVSLVWSAGQRIDAWVFLRFNLWGFRPAWMDKVMWAATQLGTFILALVLAAFFSLANLQRLAIEIMLGTISLWLVVEVIKALTDRSRPYVVLEGSRVVGWHERGLSFPSGHTAQTFFLISLMVHRFTPSVWVSLILYGIAVFVGITRMYVGAHYPRDVLAGATLGGMWSLWYILIDPYLMNHPF